MKIGINRPNFFPWCGFCAILDAVDIFIILDDIPVGKNNWVTRNRVQDNQGKTQWMSQSMKTGHLHAVSESILCDVPDWRNAIKRKLENYYRKAPYFDQYKAEVFDLILNPQQNLCRYNMAILEWIIKTLGFNVSIRVSSIMQNDDPSWSPEKRIIELCKGVSGNQYYNGKDGIEKGLYCANTFRKEGLRLFKQLYSPSITTDLSIIHALFVYGPKTLETIRASCSWEEQ